MVCISAQGITDTDFMKRQNQRHEIKKTDRWRQYAKNFLICGLTGWGLEILLTSAESLAAGDLKLMGRTSIYMFPIYGMGVLLGPIGRGMDRWLNADGENRGIAKKDWIFRHGILDMVLIFFAEYMTGSLLKSFGVCPWDYTGRMLSVDGLIRLDFAPFWFGTGLLFEYLTGSFMGSPGVKKRVLL